MVSIPQDRWGFVEHRDAPHNAGFIGLASLWGDDDAASKYIKPVTNTLLKPVFNPYKHPTYVWSNTEDFRKKIYDNFLAKIEWRKYPKTEYNPDKKGILDFQAGVNGDQIMPMNIYYGEVGNSKQHRKFLAGFLLRAFFFPNWSDHLFIKMHHLSPVLRCYWFTRFLCLFTDIWAVIGALLDWSPVKGHATNKIRLFIFLLQAKKKRGNIWTWLVKKITKLKAKKEGYSKLSEYFLASFQDYWKDKIVVKGQIVKNPKAIIWRLMPFEEMD
jgi:hypothetical protein